MRACSPALLLFFTNRTFLLSLFSSSAITRDSNSALFDCLTNTYKFTKTQALSISNRFSSVKYSDTERPQSVHKYFQKLGFSETQIRNVVLTWPNILFSCANKTLKPKVDFFKEQLGVEDSDLCEFISNNPRYLCSSLNKKLVPCIKILKDIYGYDENNKDFVRVLGKCKFPLPVNPQRLLANCAFLESCGIVGPQLSLVLKTCPTVFVMKESKLRDLISKVLDMGFSLDYGMIHHALYTISLSRNETLKGKLDFLCSFGFSESE